MSEEQTDNGLSEKELNRYKLKVKLFDLYNRYTTNNTIGEYWIGFFKDLLVPAGIIGLVSQYQIILWGFDLKIPIWIIFVFVLAKAWFWRIVAYISGAKARQVGIVKSASNYTSKKPDLSPFNHELMEQLKEIATKVGADIKFKDIGNE